MSEYPEHDKLAAVREQSQAMGEFLDFAPYTLCEFVRQGNNGEKPYLDEYGTPTSQTRTGGRFNDPNPLYESWGDHYRPVLKPIQSILAEWFDIDQDALEREKRSMLAALAAGSS